MVVELQTGSSDRRAMAIAPSTLSRQICSRASAGTRLLSVVNISARTPCCDSHSVSANSTSGQVPLYEIQDQRCAQQGVVHRRAEPDLQRLGPDPGARRPRQLVSRSPEGAEATTRDGPRVHVHVLITWAAAPATVGLPRAYRDLRAGGTTDQLNLGRFGVAVLRER